MFIFDIHTIYKMNTAFNNQCYIDDNDDIFLAWEAIKGEEPYSVYHDMSFFLKQHMVIITVLMNHIIKEHLKRISIFDC